MQSQWNFDSIELIQIAGSEPTDLTEVKSATDWNQPNLNEKISQ